MEVEFCRDCGQMISRNYRYCPFCGKEILRPVEFTAVLDQALAPLTAKQPSLVVKRLDQLNARLDLLDQDLEAFLQYVPQKKSLQG